mmetsp:Transcript_42497/g.112008  ORF Transcript_42497/g.112008 Transcript_42497/m.112008 type:complete len:1070 (+) Transcript_42497:65-3274(+)
MSNEPFIGEIDVGHEWQISPNPMSDESPKRRERAPSMDNPEPQPIPGTEGAFPSHLSVDNPVLLDLGTTQDKMVIVMVGLPARGKTHIGRRLARYIQFFHNTPTQVFNVGDYRREHSGAHLPSSFFDHHNQDAMKARMEAAQHALADLKAFLGEKGSRVGFFDATNTTKERRRWVVDELKDLKVKVMFVESVVTDMDLVDRNIRAVKLGNPDWKGVDPEEAVQQFKERIVKYASVYETIDEDDPAESKYTWIKVIDCCKFKFNRVRGYLASQILQFLMHCHLEPRPFWLTRHGQSEYNLLGKMGGDSGLTEMGEAYAVRLAEFVDEQVLPEAGGKPVRLWTSTLRRTKDTARHIRGLVPREWRNLDEIYAGSCDGLTYSEIEQMFPEEAKRRKANKLAYRYPRGESYLDLMARVHSAILEMEASKDPIVIVAHQAVLRVIVSYWAGYERTDVPKISMPLNTVLKLEPRTFGTEETTFRLLDASDTSAHQKTVKVEQLNNSERQQEFRLQDLSMFEVDDVLPTRGSMKGVESVGNLTQILEGDCSPGSAGPVPVPETKDGESFNPLPQHVPGVSFCSNLPEYSVDNPILLDVAPKDAKFGTTQDKFVIAMVGVPGRGKGHIARRLSQYIEFFHSVPTRVFYLEKYMREAFKCSYTHSPEFYNPRNAANQKLLDECYAKAMAELKAWLQEDAGCRLAFFNGFNIERSRRAWVCDQLDQLPQKPCLLFLETILTEPDLLFQLARGMKELAPGCADVSYDTIIDDLRSIESVVGDTNESFDVHNPLDDRAPWVQIYNFHKFTLAHVNGYLLCHVVSYVLNTHPGRHVFYLSRHGQSEYNRLGKIGGDSGLTEAGEAYAVKLKDFATSKICRDQSGRPIPARLWTSTLRRTQQTARHIPCTTVTTRRDDGQELEWVQMRPRKWKNLDEIYAGECDGMTYEQIKAEHPDEFARRARNKLAYRYPRGESYLDVIHRLHTIVLEMERVREPLLIVCHQAILRVLIAYWKGLNRREALDVSMPLNTVVQLDCNSYYCQESRFHLDEEDLWHNLGDESHPVFVKNSRALTEVERQAPSH